MIGRPPRAARPAAPTATPRLAPLAPLALLALALALALAVPPAAAYHEPVNAPHDFRNVEGSAFGTADLPAYLHVVAGEPTPLRVPFTLHPEQLAGTPQSYLVGFNVHDADARVELTALTLDGAPVAFDRDERGRALQPRLILGAEDLPAEGPVHLLLEGTLTAGHNGQLHVGALAVAFRSGWVPMATRSGEDGQVYAFTLALAEGAATPGLEPPFQGLGNDRLALAPAGVALGGAALGLTSAWRVLHPPAPKPRKAAATPQPPAPVGAGTPLAPTPLRTGAAAALARPVALASAQAAPRAPQPGRAVAPIPFAYATRGVAVSVPGVPPHAGSARPARPLAARQPRAPGVPGPSMPGPAAAAPTARPTAAKRPKALAVHVSSVRARRAADPFPEVGR